MDRYQFIFFKNNILDKIKSIGKNPQKIRIYYNTYIKNKFLKSKFDKFIISYPKSGRTWLYEILKLYAFKLYSDPNKYQQGLVKIGNNLIKFEHDCSDWVPYPQKKLKIKNREIINSKKIILIRDPREIIISSWYHLTFREKINNEKINKFIDNSYLGIIKIINFYNLINENLLNKSIIINYATLCNNTSVEVEKILDFFDIEINKNLISECIKDCSFENLQTKEIKTNKIMDKRSLKFRRGKIGNLSEDLENKDIKKINFYINSKLNNNFKEILKLKDI